MRYENLRTLPVDQFRRACGVKPETFEAMLEALEAAERRKRKPGRRPNLTLADQLLVTLLYHYDYRTQLQLGVASGLGESAVCRLIQRIEARLLADERFHLPKRSERVQRRASDTPAVAVDATETPIERPTYGQRRYYSGKQKEHTLKAQVSIDLKSRQILACAFAPGRVHDLTLCRDHLHDVSVAIPCLFDKGYQGIQHQHARAYLPFKARPGQSLSREQRQINRLHAAIRIRVEQVIRSLKRFRILAGRYRNRRCRFGLRFNLIAAIHNFELGLAS
jgi:hypothetical protein